MIKINVAHVHAIIKIEMADILEIDILADVLTLVAILCNAAIRLVSLFAIHLLCWIVLSILKSTIDLTYI